MGGKPRAARTKARVVAFLRGMNLGRRRITNVELCAAFSNLGFANVSAFLASGNVIFDSHLPPDRLEQYIAEGLARELSYQVPTFLRTADELRAIALGSAFPPDVVERSAGKVQVMLLPEPPAISARNLVSALSTSEDQLAMNAREIYWLPSGGISESDLDVKAIGAAAGPMTIRTKRTIERIVAKYFPV